MFIEGHMKSENACSGATLLLGPMFIYLASLCETGNPGQKGRSPFAGALRMSESPKDEGHHQAKRRQIAHRKPKDRRDVPQRCNT